MGSQDLWLHLPLPQMRFLNWTSLCLWMWFIKAQTEVGSKLVELCCCPEHQHGEGHTTCRRSHHLLPVAVSWALLLDFTVGLGELLKPSWQQWVCSSHVFIQFCIKMLSTIFISISSIKKYSPGFPTCCGLLYWSCATESKRDEKRVNYHMSVFQVPQTLGIMILFKTDKRFRGKYFTSHQEERWLSGNVPSLQHVRSCIEAAAVHCTGFLARKESIWEQSDSCRCIPSACHWMITVKEVKAAEVLPYLLRRIICHYSIVWFSACPRAGLQSAKHEGVL